MGEEIAHGRKKPGGLVVFGGPGFSSNMNGYLVSTGMAVEFADIQDWLKLYFALDAP